jgi:folylpolyglutamate synthase/dihydropteroate synthase
MPGRLEIVRADAPTVIVDAAHNEMAAEALSTSLRHGFGADTRPLVLVVGMSKGHDPVEFLRCLLKGFDPLDITLIATEPPFRPREVSDIAMAARDVGVRRVETVTPVVGAAERAVDVALQLGYHAIIVVTGSFYTIGELAPERWHAIFEERRLNTRAPADILDIEDQVRI